MKFKIVFPVGYNIEDIYNDNLDLNVVLSNDKVYFGTLFTNLNIKYLMEKEGEDFFWAADMLIVSDLSKVTIYNVIHPPANWRCRSPRRCSSTAAASAPRSCPSTPCFGDRQKCWQCE